MKTTVVKSSEIFADRTMRLDAKYWIDKKTPMKPMRTQKEIVAELKRLQKEKSEYVKEHKSLTLKSPLTDRIHKDLMTIYDYQITTLNWVLGKRKSLA